MRRFAGFALALSLVAPAIACMPGPDEEGSAAGNAIVGGDEARSTTFDAVAALALDNGDGTYRQFCTGTLVDERTVLTAEHCTDAIAGFVVLFGPDLRAPRAVRKATRVRAVVGEGVHGKMGLGADVSFVELESPVPGVQPIPMLKRSLRAEDRGKSLLAMGYGLTSPDGAPMAKGRTRDPNIRRMAPEALAAVAGALVYTDALIAQIERWLRDHGYPSLDELDREEKADGGTASDTRPRDEHLFEGYEAVVEDKALGFTCQGDSGGPHLLKTSSGYVVAGVTSGGPGLGRVACLPGATIIGTFGPLVWNTRQSFDSNISR